MDDVENVGDGRGPLITVIGNQNVIIAGDHYGLIEVSDDASSQSGASATQRQDDVFVGRVALFEAVKNFWSSQKSGYFLLTSKAGLGKTAFATRLARSQGHPLHIVAPNDTPAIVRKRLAAQLIKQWGLTGMLDNGNFPPGAGREDWFADVLAAAASQRNATQPDLPIILVLDGVDEMRSAAADGDVGFPNVLPDGVYVVVTCRSGSGALNRWTHIPGAEIRATSEANLLDMRRMLEFAATHGGLHRLIRKTRRDPEEVISLLLRRCGGVWIYLHFVLQGLERDQLNLDDLDRLPKNLWDYYALNIERWRQDQETWYSLSLPVLAGLAAARSGVSAHFLAEVIGGVAVPRIEAFLDGPLQAFCISERTPDGEYYRLYHGSLRHFLAGQLDSTYRVDGDAQAPPDALAPLRRELGRAVDRAHQGIARYFTDRWGGLGNGLPRLADGGQLGARDAYGVDHLVWHLSHTNRYDDIHLLMGGRIPRDGPETSAPHLSAVWWRVHQRSGRVDRYGEHLGWAMADAMNRMGRPGSFSVAAITLALRYALVTASLNSMAAAVKPAMFETLVRIRLWSVQSALSHARRITSPLARAEALLRLARTATAEERSLALEEGLDALRQSADGPLKSMLLLHIVPHLPPHLIASAIPLAAQIGTPGQRVGLLTRLLLAFPEDLRAPVALGLYQQALTSSQAGRAIDLLVAAAPFVPHEHALWAGEFVWALRDQYPLGPCAMALALATRLNLPDQEELTRDAVRRVRCLTDAEAATRLLAQIAPFLPPSAVEELRLGVFRLARATPWPAAVGQLAAHASASSTEILGMVRDRPGSAEWQWIIDAYAPGLNERQLRELLEIAQSSSPDVRASAVLALAPYLPPSLCERIAVSAGTGTRMERALLKGLSRADRPGSDVDQSVKEAFDSASSICDSLDVQYTITAIEVSRRAHHVTSPGAGPDIERLRTLAHDLSFVGRPRALRQIADVAEVLVEQLGIDGAVRIRSDIDAVSKMLV